jgi:subtilisin family serine protease
MDSTRWKGLGISSRFVCILAVSFLSILPQISRGAPNLAGRSRLGETYYSTNRIIIRPKNTASGLQMRAQHVLAGVRLRREFPGFKNIQVLDISPGQDAQKILEFYRKSDLVEYAEFDQRVFAVSTPNDPDFTQQWALHNTGQTGGTAGSDIHATEAWDIRTDASSVVVGVLDSGVNPNHEELVGQLVAGYNGIDGSGNTPDGLGHGTHVAGIIGASGNNNQTISGVAWNVKIMPLKFLDSSGGGNVSDALDCMYWAETNGVNIINASWGGYTFYQPLYDAIDSLRTNGIIFVAAAGNDTVDSDSVFFYPSCFWLDNIVSVGAMTRSNTLAYFSTFGELSVDLVAPGDGILSTYVSTPGSGLPSPVFLSGSSYPYGILSGTSMAAPHVAGALALLKACKPGESYLALINRLYTGVDKSSCYQDKTLTGGALNLQKALQTTVQISPPNDLFANRISVSGTNLSLGGNQTLFGNNLGGTKESSEPNHAGGLGGRSIWWEWLPLSKGEYEITTSQSVTSNGAPMDTLLAVYTGTSVGSLTLIASNDDSNIGYDGTVTSRLIVNVANTKYQIAVDGASGQEGFVKLAIRACPRNDALTNAFQVNGRSIAAVGWNLGATKEANEPDHAGNSGGRSVWWDWVAPVTGEVALSTEGSDFDTVLAVYTGTGYPLTLVASNNDFTDPELTDLYGGKTAFLIFNAVQDQVYHIAVDGASGACGHIKLGGGYRYTIDSASQLPYGEAKQVNTNDSTAGGDGTAYLLSSSLHTFTYPGSIGAIANGLNNLDQVVGVANGVLPYVWDLSTGMTMLQPVTTANGTIANTINDLGVPAGQGFHLPNHAHPCYWIGTNIVLLQGGPDASDDYGAVENINNLNEMVGWVGDIGNYPYEYYHPFYAKVGQISPQVQTLPHFGGNESWADGISDGGEIVGSDKVLSGGTMLSVMWYDGYHHNLGNRGAAFESWAIQGNGHGSVVGHHTGVHGWSASFWRKGVFLDLNRMVHFPSPTNDWNYLLEADSINNSGVIVGFGYPSGVTSGPGSGFVLQPVAGVRLDDWAFDATNQFGFTVYGPASQQCIVQASTNLLLGNWSTIDTRTMPANGRDQIVDINSSSLPARFYRVTVGSIKSDNAVGYFRRTISSGGPITIGYPFRGKDNRIPAILQGAPSNTIIFKWDSTFGNYRTNTKDSSLSWNDQQMTLRPGEGAFIFSPSDFNWTCFGEILPNCVNVSIPPVFALVSSPMPITGQIDTDLQFPMVRRDYVEVPHPGWLWDVYSYGWSWSGSAPVMGLGESFFVNKSRPGTWIQNVPIW